MSIKLGKKADTKVIKEFQQQFMTYGFNLVRFTKMELKTASTGTVKLICYLETKPIGGDFVGFKEQDGTVHEGLIARADLGIYFDKNDPSKLQDNLTVLASELGFSDNQMNEISADSIEIFLNQYIKMIDGKYTWVMLKASEYENAKGKINLNLAIFEEYAGKDTNGKSSFQIFCRPENFKESIVKDSDDNIIELVGFNKEGESIGKKKTMRFDKTSNYHYEALEAADVEDDDDDDISDAENVDDSF